MMSRNESDLEASMLGYGDDDNGSGGFYPQTHVSCRPNLRYRR